MAITNNMNTITTDIATLTEPTPILVIDPCYLDDHYTDYGGLVYEEPGPMASAHGTAAPGNWVGSATIADFGRIWGKRITKASVFIEGATVTHTTEEVQGVDAGMVGFFIGTPDLSYDEVCDIRLSGDYAAPTLVAPSGGVMWLSSSGFGDGAYPVTVSWRGSQIVGIEVVYVSDDEVAAEAV